MIKALCRTITTAALVLICCRPALAEEPLRLHRTLGGLKASVEVVIDTYGIPHIYAEHEADAMFALGYVHARDRLWQMDFNRRAAQGKLSEIMGADALEHDVFVRTIGLSRLARESEERAKDHRGLYSNLTAYSWGVNSFIAENMPDGLPQEFARLNYLPGPWTPVDSLSLGKAMAWELCGSMDDLYLGTLVEKLGGNTIDELFPLNRYGEVPIIPAGKSAKKRAERRGSSAFPKAEVSAGRSQQTRLDAAYLAAIRANSYRFRILGDDRMVGSNNWVIDGVKSAGGKPVLASDPHLGFNLPSVWYVAHVKAGDLDMIGVMLPGLPWILIGHNRHIAWGVTNTQADVTDFFVETLNDEKTHYMHRGEWKRLEIVAETLKIRGLEPRELRIPTTLHGPILPGTGSNLSMQWAGAEPADDALTFHLLNHAVDYDDFAAAMQTMGTPAQNFAYADDAGMIAMWVAGLFPVRKTGLGRIPHDGASGEFDWEGFVPRIDTPHAANPSQHYLASANQRPAPKGYAYHLGYEWDPGYRARRINRLLASSAKITTEQMKEFQADTFDTAAESMLPHMTAACRDAFEEGKLYARALEILAAWDFYTATDNPAPTIWWKWLDKLRDAVWEDEWRAAGIDLRDEAWGFTDLNKWQPPLEVLERMIVEEPTSKWFDDVSTENRETLVEIAIRSLRLAVDELRGRFGRDISKWNWGVVNRLRIDHLSGDPMLGRGGHPLGGSDFALNARGSGAEVTGGPSWRMVVDFSDLGATVGVFPGGQSGDPRSPHYDDLIDRWVHDEYIRLLFHSSPEEFGPEEVEARLTLSAPLAQVESTIP